MARSALVLLVAGDPLTALLTDSGLQAYGYDVLVAAGPAEAADLIRATKNLHVLVIDADQASGLTLARNARLAHPNIAVVYTSRAPHNVAEREKVSGAPCLRAPYHPHQLVSVIGGLLRRPSADDASHAA